MTGWNPLHRSFNQWVAGSSPARLNSYTSVFLVKRPSQSKIENFLLRQRSVDFSYPEVGATAGSIPPDYTIDRNTIRLGKGWETFRQAASLLKAWEMFKLGWVEKFPSGTSTVEVGSTVAIVVNYFGFWSLNACRIVYVFEEERSYGFAYGTLQDHAEQGEERFSVEWAAEDDSVSYQILAFSKPGKWQTGMVRPLARSLQRRFARDSMAAMKRAIDAAL
ncbi:MAG TPA: DUF1990 domain-containing protein [Pyrinomonadaceae bacterium]|nr:DUF1990 domain-containing protein [Pyrinomonadaceae bacterium]